MTTFWEIPAAYIFGMGGKAGTSVSYKKKSMHCTDLKRNNAYLIREKPRETKVHN
jgi:hypothetical protein